MRPATASRLVRLAPGLLAIGFVLGACVSTAAPGWTYEPPPVSASPAASAGGSAAPSGSAGPSGSASAAPSASAGSSASAAPASAGSSASAAPSSSGSAATVIKLVAANVSFDQSQLQAPAGKPFQIAFTNNDASVQHNVQIKGADGSDKFKGALLTGPGSTTYDIPALPAGTYTFSCVVHPTMTGTLTVQ
jgi:plastocyanin